MPESASPQRLRAIAEGERILTAAIDQATGTTQEERRRQLDERIDRWRKRCPKCGEPIP